MKFHIETERLVLREIRETDLEDMFELDTDPEVQRYLGNKPIKEKDEALKRIQAVIKQYEELGIGRWAAIEKATGHFIGWSGLKLNTEITMNGFSNFYDIGYRLKKRFWGKGYATESAKAAIQYAFKDMNLEQLYGITEKGNQASHRVLLKIGLNYVEDFYFENEGLNLRWYHIKNKGLWTNNA
ncbi:GNAT family N-acetyltransferase [Tamlana fucoidanivorans]|uniref:GNAT family N-acetyltransferase n=1 Tax=Allotamlana fucoidanivorans TaxID=2583814 RepID=A0A5C4SNK8_9FLAO|nr:GNAT family N-acetyltransferase [Tamlana fucoidanivorans]TNJ45331.1 GNAT family N-acetyltransferase [Tamlana fucoidanivorans]